MALIYRDGRPYLYRSKRRGGRVTSEYVASGEAAVLIGTMDAIERDERDYERWCAREERRESAEREGRLDGIVRESKALARDALERAGYHQHKRGEWRKRRMSGETKTTPAKTAGADPERRQMRLHRRLDAMVAETLANRFCGTDEDGAESRRQLHADIREHAFELAGPDPPPIVRSLAATAALCYADLRAAEALDHTGRDRSYAQIECDRRRVDRCHRRYLSTLKTLAQVRRLALPALQVNVAHGPQRVNNGTP